LQGAIDFAEGADAELQSGMECQALMVAVAGWWWGMLIV